MKQIIVLVGPKGTGKSTIGDLLATELGIHFLRVEPLFLGVRAHSEHLIRTMNSAVSSSC